VHHAQRRKNAHNFFHRHAAQLVCHQQIDQVIDVRQPLAVEHVDRQRAVKPLRADFFTRRDHLLGVRGQPVYQVAVVGPQRGG